MSYDPKTKRLAKSMYMEGKSMADIAEELGINKNTLKHWIHTGGPQQAAWKDVKNNHPGRVKEILENPHVEATLEDAYASCINVVARSMAALDATGEILPPSGIDRLLSALDRMQKWKESEREEESEEERKISLKNVRETVEKHPFLKSND